MTNDLREAEWLYHCDLVVKPDISLEDLEKDLRIAAALIMRKTEEDKTREYRLIVGSIKP